MRIRRTVAVTGATLAVLAGAGLTAVSASAHPAPHPDRTVHVASATVSTDTWDIEGRTVDVEGLPVDNISVTAYSNAGDTTTPVASAITYGGEFDLYVPTGKYKIVATDLDGEYADAVIERSLGVKNNVELNDFQMKYPAPTAYRAPKITGVAAPGNTLKATTGAWDSDGLTFSYQWVTGGRVVGEKQTYPVTVAYVGKSLFVRVTAQSGDALPGVAVSATKVIAKVDSKVAVGAPKVTTNNRGTVRVTVKSDAGAPLTGQLKVVDLSTGHTVASVAVTGKGTWTESVAFARLAKGTHRFEVTYTGNDKVNRSSDRTDRFTVTTK